MAPISALRPDLPSGLATVIERCMQRSVEARFANVADLAEALSPHAHPTAVEVAARVRRRLRSRDSLPLVRKPSLAPVPMEAAQQPLELFRGIAPPDK